MFGFRALECALLLAVFLFIAYMVYLMFKSSKNNNGGPRWG